MSPAPPELSIVIPAFNEELHKIYPLDADMPTPDLAPLIVR